MIIDSPIISGSLTLSGSTSNVGNTTITGSLIVSGSTSTTQFQVGTSALYVSSSGNIAINATNSNNQKLWVNGNIRTVGSNTYGSGLIRSYFATQAGTGVTFDIFRFLDEAGNVFAINGISGILFINAQDTATGGNQISYTFHLQTNGNGTSQANITQMSYQLRGNQPLQSIALANDGGTGGVKVTGNAPAGVSGCNVNAMFIGVAI
jgi:hypothetical protein